MHPRKRQHDYRNCDDPARTNDACRGYRAGREAGRARGYEDGFLSGAPDGFARGQDDVAGGEREDA